jgi:hypothetical protein
MNIICSNYYFSTGLKEVMNSLASNVSTEKISDITVIVFPDNTLYNISRIAWLLTQQHTVPVLILCSPHQRRLLFGLNCLYTRIESIDNDRSELITALEEVSDRKKNNDILSKKPIIIENSIDKFINSAAFYFYDRDNFHLSKKEFSRKYSLIKRMKVRNTSELQIKFLLAVKMKSLLQQKRKHEQRKNFWAAQYPLLIEKQFNLNSQHY